MHHQPLCAQPMFDTIGQHISLAKSRSTQSLGLNLLIYDHKNISKCIYSIVQCHVG